MKKYIRNNKKIKHSTKKKNRVQESIYHIEQFEPRSLMAAEILHDGNIVDDTATSEALFHLNDDSHYTSMDTGKSFDQAGEESFTMGAMGNVPLFNYENYVNIEHDLKYWDKTLLNLKGRLDEALKSIALNDNLGDVEKAEAKLDKFNELMKSVGSIDGLDRLAIPALKNYNEWLQNGNTSNSDTPESKFAESLKSRAEGVNSLVSSIKSLEFSLKKQLRVAEANRFHLPLEGVSSVSSESNKESIVKDELGATIEEAEPSHTEKARVSEDSEPLEKILKKWGGAGSNQQWRNSFIGFDFGLSQLKSTISSWWESSAKEESEVVLDKKGDVGKAGVKPRVALSDNTVASADGSSLEESLDIYRQRVKELGEGILKLNEMKHKGSSSADLEKQKEKVESLTHQVDKEKSIYYEKALEGGERNAPASMSTMFLLYLLLILLTDIE